MRITKYEHATLVLENEGERLVIDPGSFLTSLTEVSDVTAIVITHEHADHWASRALDLVLEHNPGIPIYAPQGVANAAEGYNITVVAPGDDIAAGAFTLEFFGGTHAIIHASLPVIDNVGVLVNGTFYYPGDSYAIPAGVEVAVLAAPLGAPWLKVSEAIDFVLAVAPRHAFGTHDMTLSVIGKGMHHQRLEWATAQGGGEYRVLEPGDSFDI